MLGGLCVSGVMQVLFAVPVMLRATHTETRDLFIGLLPSYTAVLVMTLGVLAVPTLVPNYGPLPMLLIKVAVGGLIYIGVLAVFFRRSVFESFKLVAAR